MNIGQIYLEKAWGGTINNPTTDDIKNAIAETIQMDDEHGAFWVGIVADFEIALEVNKDLIVRGNFTETFSEQIKGKFEDWDEILELFNFFINLELDKVSMLIDAKKYY